MPRARVSLDSYDGSSLINSPRSREACLRLGILLPELQRKPFTVFAGGGVSRRVAEHRWHLAEQHRCELVALAAAERLRYEQQMQSYSDQPESQRTPSRSVMSDVSSSPNTKKVTTAGMSPSSPIDPRVISARMSDVRRREELSEQLAQCQESAQRRREEHIAAQSMSDVVERVQAARARWAAAEEELRYKIAEKVFRKQQRVSVNRERTNEKRVVTLVDHSTARELKIADAKVRVRTIDKMRRQAISASLKRDEERCARAAQLVEERRAQDVLRKRQQLEETMQQAAILKANVERVSRAKMVELEARLQAKCHAVDANHRRMQEQQRHRTTTRRHFFEEGQRIQLVDKMTRSYAAHQRNVARKDRIAACEIERALVAEAKREAETERLEAAARARRAMEYQKHAALEETHNTKHNRPRTA